MPETPYDNDGIDDDDDDDSDDENNFFSKHQAHSERLYHWRFPGSLFVITTLVQVDRDLGNGFKTLPTIILRGLIIKDTKNEF